MTLTQKEAELLIDDLFEGASRLYGNSGKEYLSTWSKAVFILDNIRNE